VCAPTGPVVSSPPVKVKRPAQLVLGLLPGLRVLQGGKCAWAAPV
jgi:hypothetical protein